MFAVFSLPVKVLATALRQYWEDAGFTEIIYQSENGFCAYFGDADAFAYRLIENEFDCYEAMDEIARQLQCGRLVGDVLDEYIDENASACSLDPWGVLHKLLAYDAAGAPRTFYDMDDDPDGVLEYVEWIDLVGRDKDDEPEWLDAFLAGVPLEDLANGLPPAGMLR